MSQIWLRRENLVLIDIIQNLLQEEEYELEEHDHAITIFKGIFPEDCVEIVKNPSTGRYSVFENTVM